MDLQNKDDEVLNLIRNAAKKDIEDIQSLKSSINEVVKDSKELNEEIGLFNGLIDNISHENSIKTSENTFKTLNLIGNLYSQIDIIDDKLSLTISSSVLPMASILPKVRSFFNILKAHLKNLSSHLWQLISQLVTLKEWSIQGGLNIPNIYGLSGNIQLQITFGK